jgi:hypothetical protein
VELERGPCMSSLVLKAVLELMSFHRGISQSILFA